MALQLSARSRQRLACGIIAAACARNRRPSATFSERPEGRRCRRSLLDHVLRSRDHRRRRVGLGHDRRRDRVPRDDADRVDRRSRLGARATSDLRSLEQIDEPSVAMIANWLASNSAMLRQRVSRAAVISRGRLGRTITNGLLELPAPYFEIGQFETPASGLAWLGAGDSDELAAEIDGLTARIAGTMPVVQQIRDYLAKHLRDDLATVATALGYSPRGLQRKLRAEQSSFPARARSRARRSRAAVACSRRCRR